MSENADRKEKANRVAELRFREDESILAGDETTTPLPLEIRITLLKGEAPRQSEMKGQTGNSNEKEAHGSRNVLLQLESSIDGLWTAYQKKTWSMYFFLILGIVFALGHHTFYWHLNDKEAIHQSLMLRYGTILAFCTKASLGAAVILARRQRVWMVVRQKVIRLGTIDSIFTAAEDITALLDWRAIKKAKVATCLAIYIWVTPLIVVLTSETLSVVGGVKQERSLCPNARTLNFSLEGTMDWREGVMINGFHEMTLSRWNITSLELEHGNANSFDYYADASIQGKNLVERAVNLQQPAVRENAAQEVCSNSWNCSYIVDFVAPGYKCTELANGVGDETRTLNGSLPRFNTSDILPKGGFSYIAFADEGEYAAQQMREIEPGGIPLGGPPYPKHLGAFRTEPIIWVGYATVDDYSTLQPVNSSSKGWNDAYNPVIIGCEHYETKYKVEFNYTNGLQSYTIKHREYLRKVIHTRLIDKDANDGTLDNTTAVPEKNYVLPSNEGVSPEKLQRYRRVAAYHSLGKTFRAYLNGTISMPYYIANTDLLKTKLLTLPNYLPKRDLKRELPQMYEDIVMSLFSNPQFIVVTWASDSSIPSGNQVGGSQTNFPCLRSKPTTFFIYHKTQLYVVYIISVAIALIAVLLGAQAACQEGEMRNVKPSSILRAAKAQSLTELRPDSDQDIRDLKVGLGLVQEHSGEITRGFGLAGH
ncbi:hypothetical protein B0T10DRAFT_575904 [Thelonectria olida]|uniref:Uncharacterized protein n=1 Tax=Thelonectria olida TaxID=1576542 RepID=A0A9P9AJT9_9HYPO|nr:hypothetical protein B0T10DRAFT_575904 [Thelonectria olida]